MSQDCWYWFGAKNENGYGHIHRGGKDYKAHRVYYERFIGPIPDGLCVLHKCDNPSCVNPEHLFLGTKKDNMQDASKKGRIQVPHPRIQGELHHQAKLTQKQVDDIRARYIPRKVTQPQLAKEYGVAVSTVGIIICGANWKRS